MNILSQLIILIFLYNIISFYKPDYENGIIINELDIKCLEDEVITYILYNAKIKKHLSESYTRYRDVYERTIY